MGVTLYRLKHFLASSTRSKRVSDSASSVVKVKQVKVCRGKLIKARVVEACKESEVHGLSHMVKDGPMFMRIMWSVFFVLSNIGCSYFMYMSFCSYFSYEVITQIKVIDDTPARFPTVGVCSLNPLSTNSAHEYVERYVLANNVSMDFLKSVGFARYVLLSSLLGLNLTQKELQTMGSSLDEFILECDFNGMDCNKSELAWHFDGYYGNCFRFNPKGKAFSYKSGRINGLSMFLNIDPPTSELSLSYYTGAHVFIHNSSDIPTFFEGMDIAAGFETSIVVSRSFSRRLPSPYSSCLTNEQIRFYGSIFTDVFFQNKMEYTQSDCFNYCFQRRLVNKCGCYEPTYRQLTFGKPACWSFADYACLIDLHNEFFASEAVSNCSSECPLECDTITYSTSINFANWPTSYSCQEIVAGYAVVFNATLAGYTSPDAQCDQIKTTAAKLNVYYDSMQYVYIDESPKMYIQDLISQFGGTLGLFIGISFLTLVELLELGIQTFMILIRCDMGQAKA